MQRALIVKLGAIGDVVMTVPAVHELHRRGYSIDWICGPAVAPLLRCYSWIHVIPADEAALSGGSLTQRLRSVAHVWRAVAGCSYDLVATLYYDSRWRIFTLPVRAGRRIRLDSSSRDLRILPGRNHVDEFHRILLGLPDSCRDISLPLLRPDTLPESPLGAPERRRVALVPAGASNNVRQQILRRWPVERYVSVADILLHRGFEVILLGGPGDAWVRDAFRDVLDHPGLSDLIGATTLPELIATMDACSLVLTHDTGPLHLAGLSTAPVLALFGPTDPGSFLPRRPGVTVMWGGADLACRPCYDGRGFAPCTSNGCMQSIATGEVLAAIDRKLAQAAEPLFRIAEVAR